MIRNVTVLGLVTIFMLWCGMVVCAQMEQVGNLGIKAIKSIQLRATDTKYTADVVIVLTNKSDKQTKISKGTFDISFKTGETVVPFGKAPVKELLFNAGSIGDEAVTGETEATLKIDVGPKNSTTVSKLIKIFNIIGNPGSEFVLKLDGTGEVGAMLSPDNWVYQTGRVELTFHPSVQREILFSDEKP